LNRQRGSLPPSRKIGQTHEGRGGPGILGEVHPKILGCFGIPDKACLFEMNFDPFAIRKEKRFNPCPDSGCLPGLSLVVDASLETGKLAEAIWVSQEPYIDEVTLFDVYQKAPIPEGKKGVSYRIRYRATDRTLTDEEVNQYHDRVTARLRETFKVERRQ
jgi:phenylalanyl-tRNA synthetase beta chain